MKFRLVYSKPSPPKRVVLLGKSGIISKNLQKKLKYEKIKFISFGRNQADLKKKKSIPLLKKKILDQDVIIFISAEAPVKNIMMFKNNLKICKNVISILKKKKIENLIYISSDAVYSDTNKKIKENSSTKPISLHGKMHIKREKLLFSFFKKNICVIRPTLIYGPGDTHNGYGPNQFLKLAKRKKNIYIFGNGEEKRDHIFIEDVIEIIMKCIVLKGRGIINAATGKVNSFKKVALISNKLLKNKQDIKKKPRNGPMPHNGYRPFDISCIKKNFKFLKMKNLEKGMKKYILSTL